MEMARPSGVDVEGGDGEEALSTDPERMAWHFVLFSDIFVIVTSKV